MFFLSIVAQCAVNERRTGTRKDVVVPVKVAHLPAHGDWLRRLIVF